MKLVMQDRDMNEAHAASAARIAELEAEIARLHAALAEVDEIRDTVVLIHEREATARQEEREACVEIMRDKLKLSEDHSVIAAIRARPAP